MKEGMSKMSFKPKDIKMCVKDEPKEHKYRLCVYAALMIGISTTYQAYFDSISYRAGIMQQEALAGMRAFADYKDPLDRDVWKARKTLAVLQDKPLKDIKYLQVGDAGEGLGSKDEGWVSQTYEDYWRYQEYYQRDANGAQILDSLNQPIEVRQWSDGLNYSGPNGDPKLSQLYFTETYDQKTKDMTIQEHNRQVQWETDPIGYSTARYEEWKTMREGTIWYDTAGCFSAQMIGDVNEVVANPTTTRYNTTGTPVQTYTYFGSDATLAGTSIQRNTPVAYNGWWAPWNGGAGDPQLPVYEQTRPPAREASAVGATVNTF